MAVKNSFTYDLDQYLTTTMLSYRENGEFYDNIFKMNPTMWYLHEKGRKVDWDGSERYLVNLQYGKNTTMKHYSRYGVIDTTPQDNQTGAYFDIRQFGGSITIDRFSTRCNRGKSALQKILGVKVSEAEMTAAEDINSQIWSLTVDSDDDGDDILGIPQFITKAPNDTDTSPGGITADSTTNPWWMNQYDTTNCSSWAILDYRMLHMYNLCTKGAAKRTSKGAFIGNAPDLLMMNQGSMEAYETGLSQRSRYTNPWTEKAASYGFGGLAYKNAVMMWDEMVPDAHTGTSYPTARAEGAIYFMNTNFLNYTVDPGTDLLVEPFVKPYNQDARTALLLHYHQMDCGNRAKQGVLTQVDLAIAA